MVLIEEVTEEQLIEVEKQIEEDQEYYKNMSYADQYDFDKGGFFDDFDPPDAKIILSGDNNWIWLFKDFSLIYQDRGSSDDDFIMTFDDAQEFVKWLVETDFIYSVMDDIFDELLGENNDQT